MAEHEEGSTKGGNEGVKAKAETFASEAGTRLENWFWRLPGVRRFRKGRKRAGTRQIDIKRELTRTWLEVNDTMFNNILKPTELGWDTQAELLGMGKNRLLNDNPEGVVKKYQELGVFDDPVRVAKERDWFQLGPGLKVSERKLEMPDEKIGLSYGWNKAELSKLLADKSRLDSLKTIKTKRYKLYGFDTVHPDFTREKLHCIGKENAKVLAGDIQAYGDSVFDIVEQGDFFSQLRTKFNESVKSLRALLEEISKIENENYTTLKKFGGYFDVIDKNVKDMLKDWSPQSQRLATIRFPHTYITTKQTVVMDKKEIIVRKDIKGNVLEEYEIPRTVAVHLDPAKHTEKNNIYTEETERLQKEIDGIKVKMDSELKDLNKKLKDLRKLVNDENVVNSALESLRSRKGSIVSTIKNNTNEKVKVRIISQLITHENPAVDETLKEIMTQLTPEVIAILKSPRKPEDKYLEIENAVRGSFTATSIIRDLIIRNRVKFVKIFQPSDESGREKSVDEIYENVRDNIVTSESVIMNIVEEIFSSKEEEIKELISETSPAESKVDNLIEIIAVAIHDKGLDREDAVFLAQVERIQGLMDGQGIIFLQEQNRLKERIEEIDGEGTRKIDNKEKILKDITPKIEDPRKKTGVKGFYKRKEEFAYGLDEYGHPLEVDNDTGMVLIDKWWKELGENEWQIKTIAEKHGGADVLFKHLGIKVKYAEADGKVVYDGYEGSPTREIRYVTDKRFIGYIDKLDLASLIFPYWDAFRDDLRDGRYHPHSKSVGDYVIESMGNFDEKLGAPYFKTAFNPLNNRKFAVMRRGEFPLDPINKHWHPHEDMLHGNPKAFDDDHIPDDEKKVTREYHMRLPIEVKDGKNIISGTRSPSKYNPAFDRRARHLEEFVHWGKMYYWDWTIEKWSENPFPHISTRGIALYITYLATTDVYKYKDAEEALEGHPFDYGTRGSGSPGDMNPASGRGIVGKGTEN